MAAKKTEEFMIVNRRTGKALQASGTDNGQGVVQATPTGEDAQLWAQTKARGPMKLINKASGKALDLVHGGVENGTWAHIWEDVEDAPSQQWEIVKVTATYKKLQNVQAGKVLDIADMSEEDGAAAQLWDDVDGAGQQWKFVPAGEKPQEEKPAAKTVTKTTRKPAARKAAQAVNTVAEKAAKAVKETAQAVKDTVKPAAPEKAASKKAPARKAPAKKTK